MFILKRFIGGSLFVFALAGTALAQENRATIDSPREPVAAAPLVTAAATATRVETRLRRLEASGHGRR